MDQKTGCDEDGFAGERYPDTLHHYAEEDDQVPVLADQREDLIHGLHEARLDGVLKALPPGL
jgi:hypothetical protein